MSVLYVTPGRERRFENSVGQEPMPMVEAELTATHCQQHHVMVERESCDIARERRQRQYWRRAYGNALSAAAYSRHDELVQLLLEKGANVNAVDKNTTATAFQ